MGMHRQVGSTLAASIALLFASSALAQAGGASSGGGSSGSGASGGSSSGSSFGTSAGSGEALGTGTAAGTGAGGGSAAPALQDLRFLPGLRVAQTWSSNVLRRMQGQEDSGFITEVSPYLLASVNHARLKGDLRFSIRNFYRTETAPGQDSTDLLRYALNANALLTAPGNRYGLSASAFIQDISLSPFGVTTDDPSGLQTNRRRYSGISLSPYLTGRFGSLADYRADYRLRMNEVGGGNPLGQQADHRITGLLRSGPRFSGWGWALSADAQRVEYQQGFSTGRNGAVATLYYFVNPELRVGASANYSQVDGLNVDGKDYGVGPGLSLAWAPSSRTSLNAQWADQFYGNTSSLAFSHRTNRFTFGLSYLRGLLTGSDAALLLFNPESLFGGGIVAPNQNPVYQSLLLQQLLESGDTVLAAGLTTDVAIFTRRVTASVGYTIPRGSVLLTVYRNMRDTAIRNTLAGSQLPEFTGHLEQQGIRLAVNTYLSARSSVHLSARVEDSESLSTNQESRFTSMNASYLTRLTSDMTAGVGVRRSIQKSSGGAYSYDENAIFGTLDMKF